jgi:hypothetical protein
MVRAVPRASVTASICVGPRRVSGNRDETPDAVLSRMGRLGTVVDERGSPSVADERGGTRIFWNEPNRNIRMIAWFCVHP